MSLRKRGKYWIADFWFKKTRYQFSTRCTNQEKAKAYVAAYRTNLALKGVGLVESAPLPQLTDFLKNEFSDLVQQQAKTQGTKTDYLKRIQRLSAAPCFQGKTLDQITDKEVGLYKQHRLALKNSVATINGDLGVLRKALRWADDGLNLIRYRRITSLPGARNRTFVLSAELEKEYLSVVPYPLKQVATIMLDVGLRPEECVSLRKSDISETGISVRSGKTVNARRVLPQTARTSEVFSLLFALFPDSEWVFPGRQGKHLTARAVSNIHTLLRKQHKWPKEFVLYALRHTFATRFAESCNGDANLVMKALGHSSVLMSQKYIHPTVDYLALAFKRKEEFDRIMRGESHTDTPSIDHPNSLGPVGNATPRPLR